LKYIASQKLVEKYQPMMQPQQPQMSWWFPGQDQDMWNTPTPKQPKVENPLTQAEKQNQLLQVGWMQQI
jgi:hypothetical protein